MHVGHLEMLQWLRTQAPPGPWEKTIAFSEFAYTHDCTIAASNGNLDVLKWLRLQSCGWDAETCYAAAEAGHLEVLQWLRRQTPPCPWDPDQILRATRFTDCEEIAVWVRQEKAVAAFADLKL